MTPSPTAAASRVRPVAPPSRSEPTPVGPPRRSLPSGRQSTGQDVPTRTSTQRAAKDEEEQHQRPPMRNSLQERSPRQARLPSDASEQEEDPPSSLVRRATSPAPVQPVAADRASSGPRVVVKAVGRGARTSTQMPPRAFSQPSGLLAQSLPSISSMSSTSPDGIHEAPPISPRKALPTRSSAPLSPRSAGADRPPTSPRSPSSTSRTSDQASSPRSSSVPRQRVGEGSTIAAANGPPPSAPRTRPPATLGRRNVVRSSSSASSLLQIAPGVRVKCIRAFQPEDPTCQLSAEKGDLFVVQSVAGSWVNVHFEGDDEISGQLPCDTLQVLDE